LLADETGHRLLFMFYSVKAPLTEPAVMLVAGGGLVCWWYLGFGIW
jgi:hypothetical protein